MKTITVMRDGRPATAEELNCAVDCKPLPTLTGSGAVDPVNHPPHYTQHPSGVECIQVTECMNFCLGNAVKYIWRADLKNDAIEDLEKARWYVSREIERRKRQNNDSATPVRLI